MTQGWNSNPNLLILALPNNAASQQEGSNAWESCRGSGGHSSSFISSIIIITTISTTTTVIIIFILRMVPLPSHNQHLFSQFCLQWY